MFMGQAGWRWCLRAVLLQQFLEMMSELNLDTPQQDSPSTHAFILQKYANPAKTYPHPTRTTVIPQQTQKYTSSKALVVFNTDRKHYTPAFIDHLEKELVGERDSEFQEAFEDKKNSESNIFLGTILAPKPSNCFCYSCKEFFPDYFKHISHPVHQKNVQSNPRQALIEELIEEFGRKRPTFSGFAEAPEARKRVKLEDNQSVRSKTDTLFREASTNPPISSQPQFNYSDS